MCPQCKEAQVILGIDNIYRCLGCSFTTTKEQWKLIKKRSYLVNEEKSQLRKQFDAGMSVKQLANRFKIREKTVLRQLEITSRNETDIIPGVKLPTS